MRVLLFNEQDDLKIDLPSVQKAALRVLAHLGCTAEEVSLYFITMEKMCHLHGEFFDDPSPTDCISFPLDEKILGEVFVAPQAALDYAPKNPLWETYLYVVHGLLHLMGFDDIEEADQIVMRHKEKECMALLDNLVS